MTKNVLVFISQSFEMLSVIWMEAVKKIQNYFVEVTGSQYINIQCMDISGFITGVWGS